MNYNPSQNEASRICMRPRVNLALRGRLYWSNCWPVIWDLELTWIGPQRKPRYLIRRYRNRYLLTPLYKRATRVALLRCQHLRKYIPRRTVRKLLVVRIRYPITTLGFTIAQFHVVTSRSPLLILGSISSTSIGSSTLREANDMAAGELNGERQVPTGIPSFQARYLNTLLSGIEFYRCSRKPLQANIYFVITSWT